VGQGPEISSIFANTYNLSSFEKFFEPGYVVVDSLLTQLIPEIYVENGAYLHYANNSTALSEWIQTSANGSDVAYLLSKYGLRTKEFGRGHPRLSYPFLQTKQAYALPPILDGPSCLPILTILNRRHAKTS
jgi:hypothetical protein